MPEIRCRRKRGKTASIFWRFSSRFRRDSVSDEQIATSTLGDRRDSPLRQDGVAFRPSRFSSLSNAAIWIAISAVISIATFSCVVNSDSPAG
ncbi:hypothetical protein TIFTF001_009598 [Ficus carica]|uniref:Uncharacterized protein n=1 Tax=Ficus carica TaxID=3494 RepID=A0AA87ZV82_FICCA|nr:hypothetical protein TIFTF001_009598 [Ficus carica]